MHASALNLVVGYPLEHTLSPLLHNSLYQYLNLDAELKPFLHHNLDYIVDSIKSHAIPLTAVTMPFKENIIKHLDVISYEAQSLKAVNTIIQKDGILFGYNTDINGIKFALRHINLLGKSILILGAGGAARAAGYVLQKMGSKLFWLNRTKEKAEQLAKEFGGIVLDNTVLDKFSFDIIINTTPIGMYPHYFDSPLQDFSFHEKQIVFDMVYNPMQTQLLKMAQVAGARTISGLEMFIGQGMRQVELWKNITIFPREIGGILTDIIEKQLRGVYVG